MPSAAAEQELAAPPALSVLVIDDERNIRSTLSMFLENIGCEVVAVASGKLAIEALAQNSFDLAFLDLRLGTADGLELLPQLLAERPNLSVVVLTAHGTVNTAVEAVKRGAVDYLTKPFAPDQIQHIVFRCVERRNTLRQLAALDQKLKQAVPEIDLDTKSSTMRAVLDMIARAAASEAPVLLRGENGTGKTVLAHTLHVQSQRQNGPFVVVNCPTLSEELLTSELFGHAMGAFTGAVRDQPGRVEAAQSGTLFLDEIGEVSASLQAKLLRFLQDKQFERIGESKTRRADVRLIAATNRDLDADVQAGRFREDLLYRLNVLEVHVPSLRERPDDILHLARGFLAFFANALGRQTPELSHAAEEVLLSYPWPGNVRELRNTMERALILWPAQIIDPAALPQRLQAGKSAGPQLGGDCTLDEIEKQHIIGVLARKATVDDAAATLGIDASTLWRKRKKYEAL
jgi:two-component system, NtrC family, response regulator AlgB